MAVYDFKRIVRESYKVLLLTAMIGIISGYMLDKYSGQVTAIVLAMVPPINGIGGNVGSILGARLSSALHLGTLTPDLKNQQTLQINVAASTTMGILVFLLIGSLFLLTSILSGRALAEAIRIALIFIGAGTLLMGLIIVTSLASAFASYRHGIDPDDVVIPIVTTLVDIGGVASLLIMVHIIGV